MSETKPIECRGCFQTFGSFKDVATHLCISTDEEALQKTIIIFMQNQNGINQLQGKINEIQGDRIRNLWKSVMIGIGTVFCFSLWNIINIARAWM